MLQYKEISQSTPARPVPFSVGYQGTPPVWSPPVATIIPMSFTAPPLESFYERLWTDDQHNGYQWKRCQHYKRWHAYPKGSFELRFPWCVASGTSIGGYSPLTSLDFLPPEMGVNSESLISYTGVSGGTPYGLPPMMEEQLDGGFIPAPVGLDVLVQKSLNAMMPGIKARVSLPNSLIELKDFVSLKSTIANAKSLLSIFKEPKGYLTKKLRADFLRIRRSFSKTDGPTLREALNLGAEGYLQTVFNFVPLFKDMIGIRDALAERVKVFNDLINRQGKKQKRHYTFKFVPFAISSEDVSFNYGLTDGQYSSYYTNSMGDTGAYGYHMRGSFAFFRRTTVVPAVFHAEIEYNYNFTRYDLQMAEVKALLDQLGVNLNPAIIWNAIPFTFLIDWFIDVSRWLDQFKVKQLRPHVNVTRYLWSFKQQRSTRCSFKSYQVADCPAVPTTYLPDINEVSYRRDVTMPPHSFITGSGLNSDEFTIGAALVHTRDSRFRRNRAR